MGNCPCCTDQLLRCVRTGEVYWFCRSCWQEMPLVNLSCGLDAIAETAVERPRKAGARNAIVSASRLSRRITVEVIEPANLLVDLDD